MAGYPLDFEWSNAHSKKGFFSNMEARRGFNDLNRSARRGQEGQRFRALVEGKKLLGCTQKLGPQFKVHGLTMGHIGPVVSTQSNF